MTLSFFNSFFFVDKVSLIMIGLVFYIFLIIKRFSQNYFSGQNNFRFQGYLFFLATSLIYTFCINNIFVFIVFWTLNNFLLTKLMVNDYAWKESVYSAKLARNNLFLGSAFLFISSFIFYFFTNLVQISDIVNLSLNLHFYISAFFIILAAMAQSAVFPFYSWILNSLNSPTPVSALMHAGLVNGGGFLLIRFAPIFLKSDFLLQTIFLVGIFSSIFGTALKLVQSDAKKMLACSTVAQMGFMFVQCGLGFFSAALAHLVWHGIFKAYLFLSTPGSIKERNFDLSKNFLIRKFLASLSLGFFGVLGFLLAQNVSLEFDTYLILVLVVFIYSAQLALSLLYQFSLSNFFFVIVPVFLAGYFYGFSVYLIEFLVKDLSLWHPKPFNFVYAVGFVILILSWIMGLFLSNFKLHLFSSDFLSKLYVKAINLSQPKLESVSCDKK